jgi:hypothetical protein
MLLFQHLIRIQSCQTRLHVQVAKSDLDPTMNFNSIPTQRQGLTRGQRLESKILVMKTIWLYAQLEHAAFQHSHHPKLLNTSKYITLDKTTSSQRLGHQLFRTYMSYPKTPTHHQIHINVQYV